MNEYRTHFCGGNKSTLSISSAMIARRSNNISVDAPKLDKDCMQDCGQSGHCGGFLGHR